jgi:CheY-like chemotaxis protein
MIAADAPERLQGLRVLLVEDIDLVAMQIEEMLQSGGCSVVAIANSVSGALEAVRSIELDAAVLDVHVKGGDTFGVADELQSRGVPFVFSTGDSEGALPGRFGEAPHVMKPFEPEALWAALAEARN